MTCLRHTRSAVTDANHRRTAGVSFPVRHCTRRLQVYCSTNRLNGATSVSTTQFRFLWAVITDCKQLGGKRGGGGFRGHRLHEISAFPVVFKIWNKERTHWQYQTHHKPMPLSLRSEIVPQHCGQPKDMSISLLAAGRNVNEKRLTECVCLCVWLECL